MNVVKEMGGPVPIATACEALGLSRATLYRHARPSAPPRVTERAPNPRRLGEEERAAILDVFHSAEFVDQAVPEVYATLLSRGVYLASIRTMYRVLSELGETQ